MWRLAGCPAGALMVVRSTVPHASLARLALPELEVLVVRVRVVSNLTVIAPHVSAHGWTNIVIRDSLLMVTPVSTPHVSFLGASQAETIQ